MSTAPERDNAAPLKGRGGLARFIFLWALVLAVVPLALVSWFHCDHAVGLLVAALLVALATTFITRRIAQPIGQVSAWARHLAAGHLEAPPLPAPHNEIGDLVRSMEQVVGSFRELTEVCVNTAAGHFDTQVTARSDDDLLATAVRQMLAALRTADAENRRKISYLNSIPTPVLAVDTEFNLTFINAAGANLVCNEVEQCLGRKCHEVLRTDQCNSEHCRTAQAMQFDRVMTADNVAHLAGGDCPIRYTSAPLRDEEGHLIGAIEYITDITDEVNIADLAERVSEGDYTVEIAPRTEDDRLAEALNRMTDNLRGFATATQRQQWLATGRAELNEQIRGELRVEELAGHAITYLCRYLDLPIGAFYVWHEDDATFQLAASYAYRRRKGTPTRFARGEGLVGQAALEGDYIVIGDCPEDYVEIQSGLGGAPPANLLVFPLVREGQTPGVLELGSVRRISDGELAFLKQVADSLAIGLLSAQAQAKMAQLLQTTQEQSEELQAQQEELRAINEELEGQASRLRESQSRLEEQQEELQQTNEELEERTQALERQRNEVSCKNTELLQVQDEIAQKARELALSSKYKSEFLANMSHELRTPLNSLLILSQLLAENREGNLNPRQIEFADTIHQAGGDLLELINQVLDLSKIEAGRMELQLGPVNVEELIAGLRRQFTVLADERGLAFTVEVEAGLPTTLATDPLRLEQIVRNLVANAFKFTDDGSVLLSVRAIDRGPDPLDGERPVGPGVAIAVRDTGIGIATELQTRIFDAFQQADGTTNRRYGGTGLGLSISRELAHLLGGCLRVESTPGDGSTFTLYLPLQLSPGAVADHHTAPPVQPHRPATTNKLPAATAAPEPADGEPTPPAPTAYIPDDRGDLGAGERAVLIVEDDANFARVLLDLTREKGFKGVVAEDGESGLHLADYYRPSAVLLDVGLPRLDGIAVLARLKDNPDTRHIPVHLVTGLDRDVEALRMGAAGYLKKPVSTQQLHRTFERIEAMTAQPVRRLLLVTSDAGSGADLEHLIGGGDVHIHTVQAAAQALATLRQQEYDCMVLDLQLPDRPGIELLAEIRTDDTIPHLPIIVYTGRDLSPEEASQLDRHAESIIVKSAHSRERLLDETSLFLHRVSADLGHEQQEMMRLLHDKEAIFRGRTVLVVDDDMRNVFALTNILEDRGMSVVVGRNGREGVDKLAHCEQVDLVLMDIMMPEMDGYTAMRAIRSEPQWKELPIIALTAKAMNGDRHRCIEAGASDYLAKPVDPVKLLSLMRVWMY